MFPQILDTDKKFFEKLNDGTNAKARDTVLIGEPKGVVITAPMHVPMDTVCLMVA